MAPWAAGGELWPHELTEEEGDAGLAVILAAEEGRRGIKGACREMQSSREGSHAQKT